MTDPEGIPFGLFKTSRQKTQYEIAMEGEDGQPTPGELQQRISCITRVLSAGVLKCGLKSFNAEQYMNSPGRLEDCIQLFAAVLDLSTRKFKKLSDFPKTNVLFIAELATRYKKLPVEILYPNGGYTEIEAYLFNAHVLSVAVEQEAAETRRRNQAAVHGSLRGRA